MTAHQPTDTRLQRTITTLLNIAMALALGATATLILAGLR